MSVISNNMLAGSSGAGGDPLYVDDVFSNYLYTGDGALETVNNGINLDAEGGLVIVKNRNNNADWQWTDTQRGDYQALSSNTTGLSDDDTDYGVAFTSTGFTAGKAGVSISTYNASANNFVSYTFRKAKGFFDVVTYTGTGTSGSPRAVSHNLGSVPGMIIVKGTTGTADNWMVYHRSLGSTKGIKLDLTGAAYTAGDWGNTTPTSSQFYVNANDGAFNASGQTYVAYIFAHDDQSFGTDSDEAIVKCDVYYGNGSTSNFVNCGFEPQWIMMKRSDGGGQHWHIFDVGRGMADTNYFPLFANLTSTESSGTSYGIAPRPNGFEITASGSDINGNNYTYIYVAIRRPHKPPEAGTDVLNITARSGTGSTTEVYSSVGPVDFALVKARNTTNAPTALTRMLGNYGLITNSTAGENTNVLGTSIKPWDVQNGIKFTGDGDTNASGGFNYINYFFKRAPGFFDCLTYKGNNNVAFNVAHNLGVAPELVIIKSRDSFFNWTVGGDALANWTNASIYLNEGDGENTDSTYWNGAPTADELKLGTASNVNYGTDDFVAYLFASRSGVSKVGSYSGTGNNIDVNCGFSNGARFVMVKRVDGGGNNGDWYVWDSTRGIVSGNDSYWFINENAVEVTSTDYIDPLSSGFTITSSAPAALNTSGSTYLFLAIA